MKIINPNLKQLVTSYKEGKRGVVLEGSSRSGKTWSAIDFIILLCTRYEKDCTINIIKETYNGFKTTLYLDFNRRLPMFGLKSPFQDVKEVSTFKIFGNQINLIGADKPSKFMGASCDYFFINEALPVQKDIFDQSEMRCRKFWWMDYNPYMLKHYIYSSVTTRPDVDFLKTTFLDNPYISQPEKNKILGYELTDYNISIGTADEYKWRVYGLGERSAQKGAIYYDWKIKPFEGDHMAYWLDFGFENDPTAIGRLSKSHGELYVKEIVYETGLTNTINPNKPEQCSIEQRLIENNVKKTDLIVADSAEPKSIRELRNNGWNIFSISKTRITEGIKLVRKWRINVDPDSTNIIDEKNSYRWKKHNGTDEFIDVPEDAFNHHMDGIRYVIMYFARLNQL